MLLALAAGTDGMGGVGNLMSGLGWRRGSSQPLDDDDVRYLAATTVQALVRLGCFDTGRRRGSRPTATGQQFARAALRACKGACGHPRSV